MEAATLVLLFAGGVLSGAITAIAGGGSFLTFPMLLAAGLPPMAANITNWVALMPGNFMALAAYRHELAEMRHNVRPHLLVAFVGGLTGALLLLWTGEVRFEKAVPWLMLTATLFFAFGEWVKRRLHAWRKPDRPASPRAVLVFEFLLMIYGGYFGAGLGIVLLAALAMAGEASIHKANAKKNLMVVALSIAGLIVFLPSGVVVWAYAIPILIGSGLGGYSVVYLVRRVPQHVLRHTVLAWAILLTGVMFWKYG
ncbi:MAG: sulfite exporter TauE/SafE family protein [Burkholderiaceae bacterium]